MFGAVEAERRGSERRRIDGVQRYSDADPVWIEIYFNTPASHCSHRPVVLRVERQVGEVDTLYPAQETTMLGFHS
jgi:hypothetical protein